MSRFRSLFITGSVLFLCIVITLTLGAMSVYFEDVIHTDMSNGINSDGIVIYFQTTRVLAVLFLVFSLLFGFAFGYKLSASSRKEPIITTEKIHSSNNTHIHFMNYDPYAAATKMFDENANDRQSFFSTHNSEVQLENISKESFMCHACKKQIYNPFICKICHKNFCGEHILNGDHMCISN